MTTGLALIVLGIALALVVSAGLSITRDRGLNEGLDQSSEGTTAVESELLRRPLRSRYSA
jgi:hypothetical protein